MFIQLLCFLSFLHHRGILSLLVAVGFLWACQPPERPAHQGPNVLFIIVDDLRPEFAAYGADHVMAPNLDRLAAEGVVFERAYCNVPVCGSSRASFLSGMRPTRERFPGAYDTYLSRDLPRAVSLPRIFREGGYTTHSLGKVFHHRSDDSGAWDSVWFPERRNKAGWRDYQTQENIDLELKGDRRGLPYERADLPDSSYFDGRIAQQAVDMLASFKEEEAPFFMAVGFLKPHLPFNAPKKYWDLYDSTQIVLPANYQRPPAIPARAYHNFGELRNYHGIPREGNVGDEMARRLIHGYYAAVSYTDAQIGKVLEELDRLEQADNTIVVLIGDHGWNLGDHQLWCKHCNFESSLHTPLMMRIPGYEGPGRINEIVEFIDIYPSLVDLAGLTGAPPVDGVSAVPLLEGGSRSKNFAISKYWEGVTLIQDQYFYTEWIDDDLMVTDRMLFDHRADPLELENLAEDPAFAVLVDSMHQTLRANWGEEF